MFSTASVLYGESFFGDIESITKALQKIDRV